MDIRFLPDEPIRDKLGDSLGLGNFVTLLQSSIYNTETPFVYGVLGDWGIGKTSTLRLLQSKLENDLQNGTKAYVPIWFNAWLYENEADIIYPLLHAIKKDYVTRLSSIGDKAKTFWDKFKTVTTTTSLVLTDIGLQTATKQLTGEAIKLEDVSKHFETIQDKLNSLESVMSKWSDAVKELEITFQSLLDTYAEDLASPSKKAEDIKFVILIDDLDRCLPETTIAILESIKNYLTVKRCVFVFGLNSKVIYQGIRIKYKGLDIDGREYLEKILNYSFHVPEPQTGKIKTFVLERFKDLVDPNSYTKHKGKFIKFGEILEACNFNNPRKIKRILNHYLFFISTHEADLEQYHNSNIVRFIVMAEYFPSLFQAFLTNDEDTIRDLQSQLEGIGKKEFKLKEFEDNFNFTITAIYAQLIRMVNLFQLNLDATEGKNDIIIHAQDVFRITRLI